MKTHSTRPDEISRQWHVIDASSKPLGRVATEVAGLLRGKHKPNYAPHLDMADFVVVVNASKIQVTGRKLLQKRYYRHSGYPGGLTSVWLEKLLQTKPERVMEHAVRGMLPKNKLGRQLYRKLKVYAGPSHTHQAQVIGRERARTCLAQLATLRAGQAGVAAPVRPEAEAPATPAPQPTQAMMETMEPTGTAETTETTETTQTVETSETTGTTGTTETTEA